MATSNNKNSDMINLSLSENLFDIPKSVLQDLTEECQKINYYPIDIYEEARCKIAEFHKLINDNILLGNGVDEVILISSLTLTKERKQIMVTENTFKGYVESAKICELEIIETKITNNHIDVEDILSKITDKIAFIIICNPLNPYGTIISENQCKKIIEKAKLNNVYVIFDEAYGDFVNNINYKSKVDWINIYENIIVYRSFSKYFGIAGLRCGYAISDCKNIEIMSSIKKSLPYRVNRIACRAVISCLANKQYYDVISQKVSENKKYLYNVLDKLGVGYIRSETNFVMIIFKQNVDVNCLCELLQKQYNIKIKNGNEFGLDYCVRVGIGTIDHIKIFVKALKELL